MFNIFEYRISNKECPTAEVEVGQPYFEIRNSLFDILRFELDNDDFVLKLPELLQTVFSNPVGVLNTDDAFFR